MVDLRVKPFYLTDEQVAWVEQTIASMTLEEKIGQLFTCMTYLPGVDEKRIKEELVSFHQGGLRWQRKDSAEAYEQNRLYQKHSRIPLLIAANCDTGGAECVPDGTYVSTAAQAAAGGDPITAYHIGLASAREAGSIGANWLFNPVCDLYQACVDLIYAQKDGNGASLVRRIESKNGLHTLEHAEEIGLGSRLYTLVNLDG